MFKYFNPNPSGKETGDCVVRAVAKALWISWENAFDLLSSEARKLFVMADSNEAYRSLLYSEPFCFKRIGVSNAKGSKRPTVKSFCKSHPQGTYILELANHLVTVEDGDYYDIWDCGDKCLYGWLERK